MTEKCEACEKNFEMSVLKVHHDGPVYRVCMNCLTKLIYHSLSVDEYRALIRNGHSIKEFLLHEDFYDPMTGEAVQPVGE